MSLLNRRLCQFLKTARWPLQARHQQTKPKAKVTSGDLPPIFTNAQPFADRIALRDTIGHYSYANVFMSAKLLAKQITDEVNGKTNERVLFLCPNDINYVVTLWAIWMSGQIAVPLSPLHPQNLLLYYANDTNASLIVAAPQYADLMHRVAKNTHAKLHVLDNKLGLQTTAHTPNTAADLEAGLGHQFYEKNPALIIYTSGTTGNPKGVVLTHRNLSFQTQTLIEAWKWTATDVILHTLPLHHVHGIVNALLCPLQIGAKVIMLPKFSENPVWSYLLGVTSVPDDRKITIYMAVPTIYAKLIDEYKRVFAGDPKMVEYIRNTLKTKMRLMVSGSAPLPVPIFEKWQEITGHQLLERYGMTECGMVLSNEYDSNRTPGYVGVPLPGVQVRLAHKKDGDYTTVIESTNRNGVVTHDKNVMLITDNAPSGDLLVRSHGVFKEYYNRPEATKSEFTKDRWFVTGDVCEYSISERKFKILGRKSADIIKSGGYKISALEIETVLLAHNDIKECVVVGIPDEKYGQKIATIVVLEKDIEHKLELDGLNEWAKDKLPKYALPRVLQIVDEIPKNAMGKVNKKELVKAIFG